MKMLILQKDKMSLVSILGYCGALCSLFLLSDFAFAAETIGDVAIHVKSSFNALKKLIIAVAYVSGVGFGLIGTMKFKAHKDNPTQVPLSQPIVLLVVAAALLHLPAVLGTAGQTLFKGASNEIVNEWDNPTFLCCDRYTRECKTSC